MTIDSRFKRVMVLLLRCVMNEIEVPLYFGDCSRPWLYLAGSIEMGAAEDWQEETVAALRDWHGTILNSRRDHSDPSWARLWRIVQLTIRRLHIAPQSCRVTIQFQWLLYQPTPLMSFHNVDWWQR